MTNSFDEQRDFTFVLTDDVRLLIIDDDPIQREFACVYLSTPTATVDTASDGAEGLQKLSQAKYDLVVTDLEMPVLDGLGVIRRVRATRRCAICRSWSSPVWRTSARSTAPMARVRRPS